MTNVDGCGDGWVDVYPQIKTKKDKERKKSIGEQNK